MVGFPEIDFPNPAAEAACRLGYEGTEDQLRAFLRTVEGAPGDEREALGWLVTGAIGASRLKPLELLSEFLIPIPDREFVLKNAVRRSWIECVRFLLDQGTIVDEVDEEGKTPLLVAAETGQTDVVRLLLQHGANANVRDSNNESALYRAAEHGHAAVAECLLKSGADPNERQSRLAGAPLHAAARGLGVTSTGEEYRPVIRVLIERGAEVDARDGGGCTPLLWAVMNGRLAAIDELVAHGASLDTTEDNGQSLLHVAAMQNYDRVDRVMRYLLDQGCDTEARNRFGSTVLHRASNSPEITKLLLQRGADVNARDLRGWTALHGAAYSGQLATANLLLMHDCDPTARDNDGKTAADVANEQGHRDCAKLIWEYDYRRRRTSPPSGSDSV